MDFLNNISLVFIGGGAGAIARYLMTLAIGRYTQVAAFPWHTFGVNILGAFLIGILLEILALRVSAIQPARLLLVTGFLGGFTTFSAFSLESALLLQRGDYTNLFFYITASVIGTVAAVFAGSAVARPFV